MVRRVRYIQGAYCWKCEERRDGHAPCPVCGTTQREEYKEFEVLRFRWELIETVWWKPWTWRAGKWIFDGPRSKFANRGERQWQKERITVNPGP